MNPLDILKKVWKYLKQDTWHSWLVSLIIAFVVIKYIFFPFLSFAFATELPLVVVESCSMYHKWDYDMWWNQRGTWYEIEDIEKEDFERFSFSSGLNKGDIILVSGRGSKEVGDIIIFKSSFKYPLIHRLVDLDPISTKGDNNFDQLPQERDIEEEDVLGEAVLRVPLLGWVKLIFFEAFRSESDRGFCK